MKMKTENPRFIADINVGKLARLLRLIGYDTLIFKGSDDSDMVTSALAEDRIILTRDTQILKRRSVVSEQARAILVKSDEPEEQLQQVIDSLNLPHDFRPFTICLECNEPLVAREKEAVKDLVPVYVYRTQNEYMQCPSCHRIYWRGTHWQAMTEHLNSLKNNSQFNASPKI